jgi:hypothetical protein
MVPTGIDAESILEDFYGMLQHYQKNKPSEEAIKGLTMTVDILMEVDSKYNYLYRDIALLTAPEGICF